MNSSPNPAPRPEEIEAARLLLEKMGINLADLMRASSDSPGVPTFADYIPRVSDSVGSGTRRVYGSYWNRVVQAWGSRPITDATATEISQLAEQVKATVVQRRNARGGRGAAEHLIAALRCMYQHAVADGILTESQNAAARVPKPRRLHSTRRALPDSHLQEIHRHDAAGSVFALKTLSGGALVFYHLTARLSLASPQGEPLKLGIPGYYSSSQALTSATVDYADQFAVNIPAGPAGAAPIVIADASGIAGRG